MDQVRRIIWNCGIPRWSSECTLFRFRRVEISWGMESRITRLTLSSKTESTSHSTCLSKQLKKSRRRMWSLTSIRTKLTRISIEHCLKDAAPDRKLNKEINLKRIKTVFSKDWQVCNFQKEIEINYRLRKMRQQI